MLMAEEILYYYCYYYIHLLRRSVRFADVGNNQPGSNKRIIISARNLLRLVSQSQILEGEMSPIDGRTSIMPERIRGGQHKIG